MNEYDNDHDELDDCSSSNSFRARSNTWPLNRPDFPTPSSQVCIDETLPEIELEEDDLFTTNENWSAGFVDHDIMSWDPILNAQNQQQPQPQQIQASNQPSIIHHQPQQTANLSHQHQQQLNTQAATSQGHQRQPSIHLQHQLPHHPQQQSHQQQLQQQQHCHQQHHKHASSQAVAQLHPHQHPHEQQRPSHHRPQQAHDSFLNNSGGPSEVMIGPQNATQLQQQPSPNNQNEPRLQHQTLNNSRCLDTDDTSEYHINQLHHLSLDGPADPQHEHYSATVATATTNTVAANAAATAAAAASVPSSQMSTMCLTPSDPTNDYGVGAPEHHHQHHSRQQSHLQPLTSARYDFDHNHRHHHQQQNDYDIKLTQDETLNTQHHHHLSHLDHHHHHHHQTTPHQQFNHHHHPHQQIHQPHQHQHHHHQYHDLTSSNLDNGSGGSHMLSSSPSTSGIGLSADLEDLDYKPSAISPNYDDTLQQQQPHQLQQSELQSSSGETVKSETTQSGTSAAGKLPDSNSASKTKLNAPRRNAWGNMSYADLISQAIESTSDKRLTLAQIYDWMVQHVPYFKDKGDSNSSAGWKNSVRHNLSLHSRFKRLQNEGTGKSSWWTINPEANIGKCARRRAASMEASKYEKKRGRAKKRADAIRQGLVSYPSLTNSSLNGSTNTLGEQQSQAQSLSHFNAPATTTTTQPESSQQQSQDHNLQPLDQFANQQSQQQPTHMPLLQIQTLENYNIDQPSQQQQQHLRQLQQEDRQEQQQRQQQQQQDCGDNLHDFHQGYGSSQQVSLQQTHQHQNSQQLNMSQFEKNDDNNKLQQQQQSQYYYQQFELSTAL